MNSIQTDIVSSGAALANDHRSTAASGGHLAPVHQSGMPTVLPYEDEKLDEKGVIDPESHYLDVDVDVDGTFPTDDEQLNLPRTSESVS